MVRELTILVADRPVFALECGDASASAVLFLHGAAYRAETWHKLGSLQRVAEAGFCALAIDLPGYGQSPHHPLSGSAFLQALLDSRGLERVALLAPSMSGAYALPFVAAHPERLLAFFPIAPVGLEEHQDRLRGAQVPTLVFWGEADQLLPVERGRALVERMENAELVVLAGAKHPCYLDKPERFHELLLAFLEKHRP